MLTRYNEIAGSSLDRLCALSDGVFAVAMTLLVLDLHVPAPEAVHNSRELVAALLDLAPRLIVYLLSFMTLGIFWVGQQTQLNHLKGMNRDLAWMHIGFLFIVSLMPFSTSLMSEYITYRPALVVYWANIALIGVGLYLPARYSLRTGLVKEDAPPDVAQIYRRRVVIAQALYAFGAALCVISTYVSIAFIIAVQLNYVLAPRIWVLHNI